jgi:hypothetical protein
MLKVRFLVIQLFFNLAPLFLADGFFEAIPIDLGANLSLAV